MSFEKIYEIMDDSFPDSEMRTYIDQKKLLDSDVYEIFTKEDENGEVIAFISAWNLPSCTFLEHFAVSSKLRGNGIGSKFFSEVLERCKDIVFLEVEPPVDTITKKRVKFYEKFGFILNDFYYSQPPLREGFEHMELKVMSYPKAFSEDEFLNYKKDIYKYVYNIELK